MKLTWRPTSCDDCPDQAFVQVNDDGWSLWWNVNVQFDHDTKPPTIMLTVRRLSYIRACRTVEEVEAFIQDTEIRIAMQHRNNAINRLEALKGE